MGIFANAVENKINHGFGHGYSTDVEHNLVVFQGHWFILQVILG
jgi:hypothetical protein